jgi:hypothetical protein
MRRINGILIVAGCAAFGFFGCEETTLKPLPLKEIPSVVIEQPPPAAVEPRYAKVIRFTWRAGDGAEPVAIRHLWSLVVDTSGTYSSSFDIIKDLNENPWRYEHAWSRWIPFDAPGDSGRATILGDDESLQSGKSYIFAVQARDRAGRITGAFDTRTNARRFGINSRPTPFLTLYDDYLVGFRFFGMSLSPEQRDLPPGIPLRIRWRADASDYGGEIAGYRYAWDVPDVSVWDAPFRSDLTEAGEVTFFAGVHTLFVETLDVAGNHTLARVTVNVVPFPMDRNLLFVDAYYSTNVPVPDYSNPTESAHDAFWLGICSRAEGFEPARDVYDCLQNQPALPGPDLIGRYKNIIWTYSSDSGAWRTMVSFTPESEVGKTRRYPLNYLPMFLLRGGHLWTLGQSQWRGGLAASLPSQARLFPISLECEIAGNRDDCGGDRSGVRSMPYRDYCVTVLDKVDGFIRGGAEMPVRSISHYDCMSHATRDDSDPLTAAHPGLPVRLDLWEEVASSGRYFNPEDSLGPGGFTYVEIYDPEYWMARKAYLSQPCFHPMYRMRSRREDSALNNGTVALWVAKYEHVVPDVSSGAAVAGASVHFGFPLWFFRRSSVDSIVTVVFDEWGILKP